MSIFKRILRPRQLAPDGQPLRESTYTAKFNFQGKQYVIATGLGDAREAEKKAAGLKKALVEGRWDLLDGIRLRRPAVAVSLGQVLAAYHAAPPAPKRAGADTRKKNAQALSRFWKAVHDQALDLEAFDVNAAASAGHISPWTIDAGKLTDTLVWTWKQKVAATAATAADEEDQLQVFRGANSLLRQAQSIFSADFLEHYKFNAKLALPDTIRGFTEAPEYRGVTKTDYHPPTDVVVAATFKSLDEKASADRNLFVACWLALGFGLRLGEICLAKKSWLVQIDSELWCSGDVLAKNKKFPRVHVQLGAGEKLAPHLANLKPEDYLLEGNATEREWETPRRVSAWMKSLGWETQHHLHELRAFAIAQVAEKSPGGLYDAQAFARHKSLTTTEEKYGQHMKRRLAEVHLTLPKPAEFVPKILQADAS